MTKLEYKGFEGSVEKDADRSVWRGKVLAINDLVTYEADSLEQIEAQFRAAVDDYVETRKEIAQSA